jgi:FtsZ-binding cell division protein ZapB
MSDEVRKYATQLFDELNRKVDRMINRVDLSLLDFQSREMVRRSNEMRDIIDLDETHRALQKMVSTQQKQIADLEQRIRHLEERSKGF